MMRGEKIRKWMVVSLIFVILTACGTNTRPLLPGATLDGRPAKQFLVLVPNTFSYKPLSGPVSLPPGKYVPAMEDEDGIYFRSPVRLQTGDTFGMSHHIGGLYFEDSRTDKVSVYMVIEDELRKFDLPHDFEYSIVHKDSE